jgi:hypothetical protein
MIYTNPFRYVTYLYESVGEGGCGIMISAVPAFLSTHGFCFIIYQLCFTHMKTIHSAVLHTYIHTNPTRQQIIYMYFFVKLRLERNLQFANTYKAICNRKNRPPVKESNKKKTEMAMIKFRRFFFRLW